MDAVLTLVVVMESLEGRRRADQGEDHIRPAAGDDGDGVAVTWIVVVPHRVRR